MRQDDKPAGCKPVGNKSADCKSARKACQSFEEMLRHLIRNPEHGATAYVAAECLFAVRKLRNALQSDMLQNDPEGH